MDALLPIDIGEMMMLGKLRSTRTVSALTAAQYLENGALQTLSSIDILDQAF